MCAIASKGKLSVVGISIAVILIAGSAIAGLYIATKFEIDTPSVLRIGVLPDRNPEALMQQYGPLAEYLSAQTEIQTRLIIPADYADAVRLFREDKIDLSYFGGLTFIQAQASHRAVPLVMREIDTRFASWFLVNPGYAQMQLSDLKGKRLSFGSRLSTSGHLMPRYFLQQQWQIDPDTFFSEVNYSGAHDKTVMLVLEGKADVGAVNAAVVKKMIAEGRIAADEIHVLWQTPPYPDYVWAVQKDLDERLKTRLRDAFLGLDAGNPGDAEVLNGLNAKKFIPADPDDFLVLRHIATRLKLMEPVIK